MPPNPDANPADRDSAPYGKACAGCSKAKCRCIPRGADLSCERCHRLQKQCQPSAVVRKRAAKRRAPRSSSTAGLGEKLDDLAALLRAQAELGQRRPAASMPDDQGLHQHSLGPETAGESPDSAQTYYSTPLSIPTPLPQEPSPAEAEQYLHIFRTNHMRMFPFIYIRPELT